VSGDRPPHSPHATEAFEPRLQTAPPLRAAGGSSLPLSPNLACGLGLYEHVGLCSVLPPANPQASVQKTVV
jgi:hypothetical protein